MAGVRGRRRGSAGSGARAVAGSAELLTGVGAAAIRATVGAARSSKLADNLRLCAEVAVRLASKHSPEQISQRLRTDFPDDAEMWVSHETIYRSLYVQGKGELKRELTRCLRTGRAVRKPRRRSEARQPRISRHGLYQRTACRGGGSGPARALGGRFDLRQERQIRDRHAGGAEDPLHRVVAPAR